MRRNLSPLLVIVERLVDRVHEVVWIHIRPGSEEARRAVDDGEGHSLEPQLVPEGAPELWKNSGTPEEVLVKVRGKQIVT